MKMNEEKMRRDFSRDYSLSEEIIREMKNDQDIKILINQKIDHIIDDIISEYYLDYIENENDQDFIESRIRSSIIKEDFYKRIIY